MKLTYFDVTKTSHLIEEFFLIDYQKKDVPLEAIIPPLNFSGLAYFYSKGQRISLAKEVTDLHKLSVYGQFSKSYKFNLYKEGIVCGMNFKATSLHKLTNIDASSITNKYKCFHKINQVITSELENIFLEGKDEYHQVFDKLEDYILTLPLTENKNTLIIDELVKKIHLKEGMISVNEILEDLPFGQKTLETNFKKTVGLTPSKYIRIHRFKKLMKEYEGKKIELKDLIYMYDYYDESHFAKDFKSFTSKSLKDYFKDEFLLIKEIFRNTKYDYLH